MSHKIHTDNLTNWFASHVQHSPGNHLAMQQLYERYLLDLSKSNNGHLPPTAIKRKTFATIFRKEYQSQIEKQLIEILYAKRSIILNVKVK